MAKATCTNNQTCGDNCCWELTQNGGTSENPTYELTISGKGDMDDFFDYDNNEVNQPWKDQIDSITSVQVSNGITSIGPQSFRNATNLTSITIPDSVTSIGTSAFFGASSLTSITIPNSVTSIGSAAFRRTSLTSINIPDSVTSIGHLAFANITSLTSITIPEGVTSIGYAAFLDATGLTDITIPDTAALEVVDRYKVFYKLDLSNVTLHCAGVMEQCKANMLAGGYEDGTYNMEQAPYSKKQADGSRAYYDANGKLTGFTGKRIYTLDEANKITGSQNRVSITYR
ncbi:MAG: leucine-rich repeat domain-containing protein [Alphaproteobacteria bacterium]|nr:leucine-rich repeat domain-containing protein [Alphaproteobacteria bacterium]